MEGAFASMVFADFTNHTVVIVNNKDTDETLNYLRHFN